MSSAARHIAVVLLAAAISVTLPLLLFEGVVLLMKPVFLYLMTHPGARWLAHAPLFIAPFVGFPAIVIAIRHRRAAQPDERMTPKIRGGRIG